MNQLFTYIEAINSEAGKVRIVNAVVTDNTYDDQGVTVSSVETLFSFSNGVVLKRSVEFDDLPRATDVCAECWICYEIIDSSAVRIRPLSKSFVNQCQERFWLKMQAA